jgi:DNA-binding response OmpR family regulator
MADDNKDILDVMDPHFKKEGYQVTYAYDGLEALELYEKNRFDLILLDIMMPKVNGLIVCKKIRAESDVPIIMITAKTEDEDVVMGLDIGADDYITKPFSPKQVIARIKAMIRRLKIENNDYQLNYENLNIDMYNYIAKIDDNNISLTKKEMEILYLLAKNPSRVYQREMLLDMIWGNEYYGDIRTVDTHIKRLRAKLNEYNDCSKWDIKTVWGVGYKFERISN